MNYESYYREERLELIEAAVREKAVEQGSVTPEEIANVLETDELPVEADPRWSGRTGIEDRLEQHCQYLPFGSSKVLGERRRGDS